MLVGVPYDLFWGDITPTLFGKFTKAYERRMKDVDSLNHTLGQYIAIGINNPSKFPKHPYMSQDKDSYTPKDFQQIAKQRYSKKEE